jgi:predicted dehydrogenase
MPEKSTAAVVGAGFIGPVHVEALRRLGVSIKGVLDVSPELSEKARRTMQLGKAYQSFEELIADPEVQVVHLTVPNMFHYEMAKKALKAGKHVMCEKPLAMTSEESSELVEIARKTGLVAGVCYNLRFYPLNLQARHLVRQGDIGEVYSIVGSYVQDWLLYDTDYNWRVLAEQGGALRAVADIGSHWMDLVLSITGLEVKSVFANLHTVHTTRRRPKGEVETFTGGGAAKERALEPVAIDTEDCGSILFQFDNGGTGNLWVSQTTAGRKNCLRYEISGGKQALAWNSESPNELWIGNRSNPNLSLLRDPGLLADMPRHFANYPGGHNEGFPDAFKQCFRAFYEAVAEGKTPKDPLYATFDDGHKEILLFEAILKSHQERKWVDL